MKTVLSVDLGAGSGRVIAAFFDGSSLRTETVSRFSNDPVEIGGHIYWNFPGLLRDIRAGLAAAAAKFGPVASVGVDSWGVDYGFLDKGGRLLGLPCAYRDARNCPANTARAFEALGRRALYDETGIQFIDFNTVFQLFAERAEPSPLLDRAERMLFIPDLVNWALCGEAANEATDASTSGMVSLETRDWSPRILSALGIAPGGLLRTPVRPGARLGAVRGVPGLENVPVIAVGSHDTASAVAAVPAAEGGDWAYLATGTWALLGIETPEPMRGDAPYELNWTHEGAANGQFRFLKNCTGMWMVQELRRAWTAEDGGAAPEWDDLMHAAEASAPFRTLVDPDWAPFQSPGGMPAKIAGFARLTGQPVPETRGEFYRAAMEGVVMRYREVWGELRSITGVRRGLLHVIGGATRDAMHCRMAADALDARLVCGPDEGAATGNAIAQLVGLGDLSGFAEGRDLVRRSVRLSEWAPENPAPWAEAFPRWLAAKRAAAAV
ncbi:MAG: rhamnulokinase [Kiritimatiellae bacterium]|nr:rhamnulokinase [Kiritimatiellia bacterium]